MTSYHTHTQLSHTYSCEASRAITHTVHHTHTHPHASINTHSLRHRTASLPLPHWLNKGSSEQPEGGHTRGLTTGHTTGHTLGHTRGHTTGHSLGQKVCQPRLATTKTPSLATTKTPDHPHTQGRQQGRYHNKADSNADQLLVGGCLHACTK